MSKFSETLCIRITTEMKKAIGGFFGRKGAPEVSGTVRKLLDRYMKIHALTPIARLKEDDVSLVVAGTGGDGRELGFDGNPPIIPPQFTTLPAGHIDRENSRLMTALANKPDFPQPEGAEWEDEQEEEAEWDS